MSGQALPPPTGSAARPRWCSGRRRVRPPARLGDLTSFGAAPRSPARPSGPSGALHTCGVVVNDADRCVVSDVRPGSVAHGRCGNPVGLAAVSILAVLGMDAPKVQTTSVKLSEFGVFWARWSAIWAHCGRDCDERGNGGHLRGSLQVGENGRCADVGRIPSPVTSGNLARSPEAPKPRSPEVPKPV